jgi:hypothetical protein
MQESRPTADITLPRTFTVRRKSALLEIADWLNRGHFNFHQMLNCSNFKTRNKKRICKELERLCGLLIQNSGCRSRGIEFHFRRYQIFWELVSLVRVPLSLASTIEWLLERKSCGSGLRNREYDRRNPPRWPRDTLYSQMLVLASPTNCGRSVGIVRSRTKATE